jgi:hypothetical protein
LGTAQEAAAPPPAAKAKKKVSERSQNPRCQKCLSCLNPHHKKACLASLEERRKLAEELALSQAGSDACGPKGAKRKRR